MPDKINPEVPIMLDKERHLRLDLNAMHAFQESTGKNLFNPQIIEALFEKMNPSDLRAFLWACLLHEDKSLTLDQVGNMIHHGNLKETIQKVWEAWGLAMPKPEGEEKNPLAESPPPG